MQYLSVEFVYIYIYSLAHTNINFSLHCVQYLNQLTHVICSEHNLFVETEKNLLKMINWKLEVHE